MESDAYSCIKISCPRQGCHVRLRTTIWGFPLASYFHGKQNVNRINEIPNCSIPHLMNKLHRVRKGHGKPGKSWNVRISFSRPGKSWNLNAGP